MSALENQHNETPILSEIIVDIEKPAHGGTCIARYEGYVVFVRGALPGERDVHVLIDPPKSEKASFLTGEVSSVGVPSVHRIPSQCPAHVQGAGCCDLDFVDLQGSLAFKKAVVLDQLQRIGGVTLSENIVKATSLEPELHYRQRTRLGVDDSAQPGIYKNKSHVLVPIAEAHCAQWKEGLVELLPELELVPRREVIVAQGSDGQVSAVQLERVFSDETCTKKKHGRYGRRNARRAVLKEHMLTQQKTIQYDVDKYRFEMRPQDFWQAHSAASEYYFHWVRSHLQKLVATRTENVEIQSDFSYRGWDLFGGAGIFAAALCSVASPVVSIDMADQAQKAGEKALNEEQNLGIEFISGDVSTTVQHIQQAQDITSSGKGLVVVDPPRTGLGKETVNNILGLNPGYVIHIGCDPAATARDIKYWYEAGFVLEEIEVVDAFPLTHHVEVLCLLKRL